MKTDLETCFTCLLQVGTASPPLYTCMKVVPVRKYEIKDVGAASKSKTHGIVQKGQVFILTRTIYVGVR